MKNEPKKSATRTVRLESAPVDSLYPSLINEEASPGCTRKMLIWRIIVTLGLLAILAGPGAGWLPQ